MKLTLINQSQPNNRYIIHDTTPEYNIPDLNLTEFQNFVIGDKYSNNLHICTESEFIEYFKDNHEIYDCVIFNNHLKNSLKLIISTLKNNINNMNIEINDISGLLFKIDRKSKYFIT